MLFDLCECAADIVFIHDVVPVVHGAGLMPHNGHGNRLGDTGTGQLVGASAPQIMRPPFRTTHVSLSNFWVSLPPLCKGGDYVTLVPPWHPATATTVPHPGLRSLGSGRGDI